MGVEMGKRKYFTEKERIFGKKMKEKEWKKNHKEERKIYQKEWKRTHKEETRIYQKEYIQNNINLKLSSSLRRRLRCAIYNNQKSGSAVRDLGCSIPEFKIYLKSKFQDGMSWDNYGYREWHIDHIIPLASFDLSNREEFLKACHYTNLQPLWAEENFRKNKRKNYKNHK